MGFIERLRQEEIAKYQQINVQQEAQERDRLQREANECERRAQRKQQAEKIREESKVGEAVQALGEFLGCRGSSSGPVSETDLPISRIDPDSVLDLARWDKDYLNGRTSVLYLSEATDCSETYIAAESCPDGTIVFHGNWLGSTTIRAKKWRSTEKEQIFDKALEKAFRHPRSYKYPFAGYKLINQNTFG